MKVPMILLCMSFVGCEAVDKKKNTSTAAPANNGTSAAANLMDTDATIKSMDYDAATHSIQIKLEYGACNQGNRELQSSL